jgi:hypothetical protein
MGWTGFLISAAAIALSALPAAQPAAQPWTPDTALDERLAALRPDDPEAYFLLAEEVADGVLVRDQAALARTLYVLAYELDRARPGGGRLGASACLGLAAIERLEERRLWLTALAGVIDRRYASSDWNVPALDALPDEVLLRVAQVLGDARAARGRQADDAMRDPLVMGILEEYEALLGDTGFTGGLSRLKAYARDWPCPECRNERVVPRRGPGVGPGEFRLCPTCNGNPGPRLTEEELFAHLRFESRLLSGLERSWAAQAAANMGAPLRDPDPAAVAPTMGVDPVRAVWRDGQWVAPGRAP